MQNTKITDNNLLPDEVKIDLNVFSALMLNWVGGHVDGIDVVLEAAQPHQAWVPRPMWSAHRHLF